MIQLIVAAVAHFDKVEKFDDNSTAIEHCFQERGKSVVAGSYWFGAILLIAFIALLIVDLCVKKDEEDEHHLTVFDIIRTSIAVAASILYMIGLVFVVHVDSTSQCLNHGRWFIFLALFPAFVGLLVSALQTVKSIREKRREIQEYRYSMELLRIRSQSSQKHLYLFDGFPHLSAKAEGSSFKLDEDVLKEIGEVLIDPGRIDIKVTIGKGNFGEVFKGMLDTDNEVAVKSVQDVTSQKEVTDFIREGLQMKAFDHPNVMELVGICWLNDDSAKVRMTAPLIVLPFMERGDLKNYLRKSRPGKLSPEEALKSPINLAQLAKFCHQIGMGMEYLSKQGIIHRDLAARNCMVNNDLDIKVADFGLSRAMSEGKDYYRMGQGGQLSVKWMAPESLIDFFFTEKSDVWAFGVTMWEVMTLAQVPYPGVSNQDVIPYLKRGNRLHKPDECPFEIYEIMKRCWIMNAEERPTFTNLVRDIEEFLTELMNYFDPNAADEPVPPDPYSNWSQARSAEIMEIEEQAERERANRENEPDGGEGLGLELLDKLGRGGDVVVNMTAVEENDETPRYHQSELENEETPRYHQSELDV
ncbi:tyrosine-protein kinase receptor UFO-like [Corticium candelabrum]|uniref:tyrosine-protein kinase receptor UFO-like n=1 Tax=Corticium candelabrum TaxID=121492 RepID=UPI002E26469F|nr:tyrosine-protein kinase receptor UFO-like [Corticium candelabrum]